MGVTGTCAEVFYLALPEDLEVEDQPLTRDEAVAAFRERFVPVPEDERLDLDVDDNVF